MAIPIGQQIGKLIDNATALFQDAKDIAGRCAEKMNGNGIPSFQMPKTNKDLVNLFTTEKEGIGTFTVGKEGTEDFKRFSGLKIAGTALGFSAGYRVLSGGGLYKDKDGNTDIIGIPFV